MDYHSTNVLVLPKSGSKNCKCSTIKIINMIFLKNYENCFFSEKCGGSPEFSKEGFLSLPHKAEQFCKTSILDL